MTTPVVNFPSATPPTIAGSVNLGSDSTLRLRVDELRNGDTKLIGGDLTGLSEPINNQDSATKQYVDTAFNSNGTVSTITANRNIDYTGAQIVEQFIQRNPNGGDRTDLFPTAAELVSAFGTSVQVGSVLNTYIFNISANTSSDSYTLTINLVNDGVTVIGSEEYFTREFASSANLSGGSLIGTSVSSTPVVNPLSFITIRTIFMNVTSGTEAVDVQYTVSNNQNLSNLFYYDQNALNFTQALRVAPHSTSLSIVSKAGAGTAYTAAETVNTILTRDNTGNVTDTLPTASDILTDLGFTGPSGNVNNWDFKMYLRNKGTGSVTLVPPDGTIVLDGDSNFTIPKNRSATLLFKSNTGLSFTVYVVRFAEF